MPRWAPNTKDRLARAALELYLKQGYPQTTVSDIAQKAGTTERTFFRHFADKSEVLFGNNSPLQQQIIAAIGQVTPESGPLDTVVCGLQAAGQAFQGNPLPFLQRQQLISSHPELYSRELHKLATLGDAITEALHLRGVAVAQARLSAEAGLVVFKVTYQRWLGGTEATWAECLQITLAQLRQVMT